MNRQTVIPSTTTEALTFDNFEVGRNRALVETVRCRAESRQPGQVTYVWGEAGAGKTHLLHACCATAAELGRPYVFLGCDGLEENLGEVMEQCKPDMLICMDDLHPPEQGEELEWGWLSLHDTVHRSGGNLVVTASRPIVNLGLQKPDLISRLSAGGIFHLVALDDEGKRRALMNRARGRGFDMSDAALEFIMRHHDRDTGSLFRLLDRLDSASLSQQRRITIPFLKQFLAE